jgi:hypothetical protein
MEELPPNEFFFDKKRKVVVKREFYQEGGSTVQEVQSVDRWERQEERIVCYRNSRDIRGICYNKPIFSRGFEKSAEVKKSPHQNLRS